MALDALDPGPNGDYPHLDPKLQPTGPRTQLTPEGRKVLIDVEATGPDGRTITQILADKQD